MTKNVMWDPTEKEATRWH